MSRRFAKGLRDSGGPRAAAAITRLQQAITQSMPDLKQRFEAVGGELMEVAPDRLSGIIKTDYDRWIAIIREAGIRLE